MAISKNDLRIERLEITTQKDGYMILTPDEKRMSMAWHLWETAIRSLSEFLGTEDTRRQVIEYTNSLFNEWQEAKDLPEDIWELLHGQGWLSYSWCKGLSVILQDEPGQAKEFLARADELKAGDEVDLGRTGWWYTPDYPIEVNKIDARELLKGLNYGTFGPKDQAAGLKYEVETMEYHYRKNLLYWIDLFGEDIVKEFIDLRRVYRFSHFRKKERKNYYGSDKRPN